MTWSEQIDALRRELTDCRSRLSAAEQERDNLGNELAQERAKPGGTYDQAAYNWLAAELSRVGEKDNPCQCDHFVGEFVVCKNCLGRTRSQNDIAAIEARAEAAEQTLREIAAVKNTGYESFGHAQRLARAALAGRGDIGFDWQARAEAAVETLREVGSTTWVTPEAIKRHVRLALEALGETTP